MTIYEFFSNPKQVNQMQKKSIKINTASLP